MPMYEYACHDCGREFEALVRSDTVPECPGCHSKHLDKLLSVFATAAPVAEAAEKQEVYRSFGHYLGLAFQVQDDILGIWGDEQVTGKSVASDLVEGKNSLPVLARLDKKGKFAERWKQGPIQPEEVREVSRLLASEGGLLVAQESSKQMTDLALRSLEEAEPQGEAGDALFGLTKMLLSRNQ